MIRPDIAYVVNLISQFMQASRTTHLSMMQHIFRHLQGIADHGLMLEQAKSPFVVLAYSDADVPVV